MLNSECTMFSAKPWREQMRWWWCLLCSSLFLLLSQWNNNPHVDSPLHSAYHPDFEPIGLFACSLLLRDYRIINSYNIVNVVREKQKSCTQYYLLIRILISIWFMLFFDFVQVYFVNTTFQNLLHCRYCLRTVIRQKI